LGLALLKFTDIKRNIGKTIVAFSIIWGVLCSQYFFSYWLIAPLENAFEPIPVYSEKWQSADAIWVLACFHFEAEELPRVSRFNQCSLERLVHAANMYRVKPMPVFLTGGDFNTETTLHHASEAAALLIELGVEASDIVIIDKGYNTASEGVKIQAEINKLEKPHTLAVVSSASHGIRLSKMLTKSDIKHIFIPVHYATKGNIEYRVNMPSATALARSERALYEYAANIKYWLQN
jgi:uncharacterized SAM-binding protein YcdF (DUF218 family)